MNTVKKEIFTELRSIFKELAEDVYMEFIRESSTIIYIISIDLRNKNHDNLRESVYQYNRLLCVPSMDNYFRDCILDDSKLYNKDEITAICNNLIWLHNSLLE